jgi:4-amino-4-deoxy-L-arabinose transferase-like glycosyltransferase
MARPRADVTRALFGTAIACWVGVAAILAATSWLRLKNVGHTSISLPDETCHALVARNLLRHPLEPTLIDREWIPPDRGGPTGSLRHWGNTRVWLHKPILPLWQIALSYAAFGVDTFALRLPSALLATGAVLLTFLIGRSLFDRATGLVAAAFQAVLPAIGRLVHGYLFSDHVDVSLLFWAELGIFFGVRLVRTGRTRDAILAGIGFGFAYLSKYWLGLVVPAVVGLVWLLGVMGALKPESSRLRFRHLVVMSGAGLAAAGPWIVWCLVNFRSEFLDTHVYFLRHLTEGLEAYAAPWDRLVFEYLPTLWGCLFVPVVIGTATVWFTSLRRNRVGLAVVLGWLAIVLVPHLLATSKTPTATAVAIPAACLLIGALVAAGTRLDAVASIAAVAGTMTGSVFAERLGQPKGVTLGWYSRSGPSPSGRFAGVLFDNPWLVPQLLWAAAALTALLMLEWTLRRIARGGWLLPSKVCGVLLALVALAGAADACRRGWLDSREVAEADGKADVIDRLAMWAGDALPVNAVLFFDGLEYWPLRAQFWSDRTCYVAAASIERDVEQVVRAGGVPFLVTKRTLDWLSLEYTEPTEGSWKVYGPPGR